MREKILVTGASGFIGRYVTERLWKQGYDITVLVHRNHGRHKYPVTVLEADICDKSALKQVMQQEGQYKGIVHLAADVTVPGAEGAILTNCLSTYHVALLANWLSVKCFVYMSSIPVIGKPERLPVTEEHPVKPETLYHITKYAGEQIVNRICKENMRKVTLRISSPIGEGMSAKNYLSVLLEKCRKNEVIEVYGQGFRKQNYIDVRDVATAVAHSIASEKSGTYLIAGKKEITNRELAFLCRKVTGSSSEILWGLREDPEEENQWMISCKKAEKELGFFPQYELEESIRRICGSDGKMERGKS